MQSIIDVSNAVSKSGGIKRAASPSDDHHPPSQHAFSNPFTQAYYYKRLRTSTLPTLAVWHDFRKRELKIVAEARRPNNVGLDPSDWISKTIVTPSTSAQQSQPDIEPQRPGEYFRPDSRFHNFYTKASIQTTRGAIDLKRVQINARSPFNLVPRSVATNLDLMLYSGKTLAIAIADRLVQTNHYSQFTIRVAGQNTMITAGVISGLQMILLGHDWIRTVHLLNDVENQNYFIPVPLAVEVAGERLPHIVDTDVEAKDIKPVEMAKCNDKFRKADCGEDGSPNSRTSLDDGSFLKSESRFDSDTTSNELPLGDDPSSNGRTSKEDQDKNEDKNKDENEDEKEDKKEDKDENETDEDDEDKTDKEDEDETNKEDNL